MEWQCLCSAVRALLCLTVFFLYARVAAVSVSSSRTLARAYRCFPTDRFCCPVVFGNSPACLSSPTMPGFLSKLPYVSAACGGMSLLVYFFPATVLSPAPSLTETSPVLLRFLSTLVNTSFSGLFGSASWVYFVISPVLRKTLSRWKLGEVPGIERHVHSNSPSVTVLGCHWEVRPGQKQRATISSEVWALRFRYTSRHLWTSSFFAWFEWRCRAEPHLLIQQDPEQLGTASMGTGKDSCGSVLSSLGCLFVDGASPDVLSFLGRLSSRRLRCFASHRTHGVVSVWRFLVGLRACMVP